MPDDGRWRLAQAHERGYWQYQARGIDAGQIPGPAWYEGRAATCLAALRQVLGPGELCGPRVVEVGSGPVGIVTFLPGEQRFAIDPLNDYYSSEPAFTAHRSPDVRYLTSPGEELPFGDASVDTVVSENALDHVRDPGAVVAEVKRILRPGGVFYLRVEVFSGWGALVHSTLAKTRLDPLHPHSFTPKWVGRELAAHGLEVRWTELGDFAKARRRNRSSKVRSTQLWAFLGMAAVLSTTVAIRR